MFVWPPVKRPAGGVSPRLRGRRSPPSRHNAPASKLAQRKAAASQPQSKALRAPSSPAGGQGGAGSQPAVPRASEVRRNRILACYPQHGLLKMRNAKIPKTDFFHTFSRVGLWKFVFGAEGTSRGSPPKRGVQQGRARRYGGRDLSFFLASASPAAAAFSYHWRAKV